MKKWTITIKKFFSILYLHFYMKIFLYTYKPTRISIKFFPYIDKPIDI